jgi:hypothetical protein
MTRHILILPLLLLFMLPVSGFAASSGDAPLTLLNKPSKSPQTVQNQNISNQDNALHDIHGPVPIIEQPPYLLIAGIVLFVLLVAAAVFWFLKKKGKAIPPPISPWEKALLDLADAKKLLRPERALAYMDRASQILRQYIEARFAIQSTRQTTREFLQGLAHVGGNSPLRAHKNELQDCLEQADMAKFAHHHPALSNLEQMEVAVTTFIKKTEPVDQPKVARPAKQSKQAQQTKGVRS